jgi:hypothetical protein
MAKIYRSGSNNREFTHQFLAPQPFESGNASLLPCTAHDRSRTPIISLLATASYLSEQTGWTPDFLPVVGYLDHIEIIVGATRS